MRLAATPAPTAGPPRIGTDRFVALKIERRRIPARVALVCPLAAVRRSLSAVRCPLSAVRCPPLAVRCPLSAVRRPPLAVRCPLSAVHRPSSIVHRLSSTVHRPPSTVRRPSSTVRRPLSTVYSPPSTARPIPPHLPPPLQIVASRIEVVPTLSSSLRHMVMAPTVMSCHESFIGSVPV